MTTTAIRKKLHNYLEIADDKKIKAIYTIIENELEEESSWCDDKKFVAELNRRTADFKSGKVKGVTWQEAKKQIKARTTKSKKNGL